MKTLILTLALLTPTFASASSMDEACSSATGSVKTTGGHRDHTTTLLKREYTDKGIVETPVTYSFNEGNLDEIRVETLSSAEINREEKRGCRDGMGSFYGKTTSVRKIRVTKADGSKFSDDFLDVKNDGSVETYLVCELVVTSLMPCRN